MKITAYLNRELTPQEEKDGVLGCNYSKDVRDKWINNDSLHPRCKEIPVEQIAIKSDTVPPEVKLEMEGYDDLVMTGNQIEMGQLQATILKRLHITTK